MKYKVMYTAGAKKDLRNIFRYISEELLAPENAAGQTDRIMGGGGGGGDAKYYKMAECHKFVKIHQLGQMFLAKA